jgi:hypothetical protein
MNDTHAIAKLHHAAAILASRPFARYFTGTSCVFGITSERLHGWLRSQFCQDAGAALKLDANDKSLFQNLSATLAKIATDAESIGVKLTGNDRTCRVPRNTDFVLFYHSQFGMEAIFDWIDWYNQLEPDTQAALLPSKRVLFALARLVEARHTLTFGSPNAVLQTELKKLLVSKGEDWLLQGLPHDILAYVPHVVSTLSPCVTSRHLIVGDIFATAEVRYGLSATSTQDAGAGYCLIDISEQSINTAVAAA